MSTPDLPGIVVYATRFCPYCMRARELLEYKGVAYEEIAVDGDPERRREMELRSRRRTVPQIFIDGAHIGGYDDLHALDLAGKLDRLLFPDSAADSPAGNAHGGPDDGQMTTSLERS
ncbi:MAG: glutaredoxin 3 [Gammaproteobacteria bacterium]